MEVITGVDTQREVDGLRFFDHEIAKVRENLLGHSIFTEIKTPKDMNIFMEVHIFAVWDFMSLLKSLQKKLTSISIPWMAPVNRDACRFINEIVVCEESDEVYPGHYMSHYELYLEAMEESGANTQKMRMFIEQLSVTGDMSLSLEEANVSSFVRDFVYSTMNFAQMQTHEVAAAFLYGREDLIPDMFSRFLRETSLLKENSYSKLKLYLERHIELDGNEHGPMAKKLMINLCKNDEKKWHEAISVAKDSIEARIRLWDGVLKEIKKQ